MYHFNGNTEHWFIFGGNGLQQIEYNISTRELKQDLLHGQPSLPDDFLQLIKQELDSIQDAHKNYFK